MLFSHSDRLLALHLRKFSHLAVARLHLACLFPYPQDGCAGWVLKCEQGFEQVQYEVPGIEA